MHKRLRAHVRQNAVAWMALFVALGGTSYAAATVGSGQIVDDSIRTQDVRNDSSPGGGLLSRDIRNDDQPGGGLGGPDIRPDSLSGSELKDLSVAGRELRGDSITSDKVAQNSLTGADIDEGTLDVNASTQTVQRARGTGAQAASGTGAYAMSGDSWTQAADEVNLLLGGEVVYDAPSNAGCDPTTPWEPGAMSGTVVLEDGRPLGSFGATASEEGEQDAKSVLVLNNAPYVFEPGRPTERTLRVEVHDSCQGEHFVVKDVKVNVLRAR